jgi:hypothetical protein
MDQGSLSCGWRAVWEDYLHGCLLNLYVVIEESVRTEPWRWYGQLVNVLSAVGDRDALGVLSGASLVEEATGPTGSCTKGVEILY